MSRFASQNGIPFQEQLHAVSTSREGTLTLCVGPHDDVRLLGRLARALALRLPALLHGQPAEVDGLAAADCRGADCGLIFCHAPQVADHRDAAGAFLSVVCCETLTYWRAIKAGYSSASDMF